MSEWEAEIQVDEALVRRLIGARYPELVLEHLEPLGIGWDNAVWTVERRIAFRFPRRAIAIPGIVREMTVLPALAPQLPRPIPNAEFPGSPTPEFPWPWFGSRMIDGVEIPASGIDDHARERLAEDLGEFLRCLHSIPRAAFEMLPIDPMGRADMTDRVPKAVTALAQLDPSGVLTSRAEPILRSALRLPQPHDCVPIHGDLHVRHALVDDEGRLCGVIDWGDVCLGSASIDLTLYWSTFSTAARNRFLAAYGDVDRDTLLRARVLALSLNAMLAGYARTEQMSELEAETLEGIERTLAE